MRRLNERCTNFGCSRRDKQPCFLADPEASGGCGPDSPDRIISSVSGFISSNKTGDPTDLPDAASRISNTSGQHSPCSQPVEHVRQRWYLPRLGCWARLSPTIAQRFDRPAPQDLTPDGEAGARGGRRRWGPGRPHRAQKMRSLASLFIRLGEGRVMRDHILSVCRCSHNCIFV